MSIEHGPSPEEMGIEHQPSNPPEELENSQQETPAETEKETTIESAAEGVEKSKEIIEDILGSLPDPAKLSEQFSFRMKQYAEGKGAGFMLDALEESKLMSLHAELMMLLDNINTRQRRVRNPDNFSFSLMLPKISRVGSLRDYLRTGYMRDFDNMQYPYSVARTIGEKLSNLERVVGQTREILDKEK